MLPQLDISHYTSQCFWLFVSLASLIWFLRAKIIRRMNNIMENRQKVITDNDLEVTALEPEKAGLQRQEELLKNQAVLEWKQRQEDVRLDYLKNLTEQLNKLEQENNDRRLRLTNENIDCINNNDCWCKEAERLTKYALKKLKNIGSL